ncbi:MAG: SDR family oxidoreductase [Pseudomonadota bacterium]
MKVMVTGHMGYVGAVLVPMLLERGHYVAGMDSGLFRDCAFGAQTPPSRDLRVDIRNASAEDLAGFDAVIHLAALSNDPLGEIDPHLTHEINTVATEDLARAAKAAGASRFLFSSSCSSYGASGDAWLTEEASLNPLTPYAVSKVKGEKALDALASDTFSPVYLRSGTAYGLSPMMRCDLVANNLTAYAVAQGQILLKSDGSAWRPLVHVEDMAQAFICALEAPRDHVHREVFNVGRNSDCMQIRDLAEIIGNVVPDATVEFTKGHTADARTYRVDCTKIKTLGYAPKREVGEAVAEMAAAFRKAEITEEEFEGPRYVRLAALRKQRAAGRLDANLRESVTA